MAMVCLERMMAKIEAGRFAGKIDGEFVVFIIGMRVNNLLAVNKWLPMMSAMPKMIKELVARPDLGLLHVERYTMWRGAGLIQYWRSYDHLHDYAHDRDRDHLPAWVAFNQAARGNTAVGIYHESYLVGPGRYETVYVNMPKFGLASAGEMVPAVGSMKDAADRLRASNAAAEHST
jgi:hypothetical protein